jgi:hypothetical protein
MNFTVADHVIVICEGRIYPGIVKHVTQKDIRVSAMDKSGNLNWK